MRLVLFDIDGTLLRCGPQVRPLFAAALREVFGSCDGLDAYDFAGKTDPRIVVDVASGFGWSQDAVLERLPRMRDAYVSRLENGLERERMELLPGVLELLGALERREDVEIALLTGNWEAGARVKLGRFDLGRFFRWGVFGDDALDRRELPPVALERALRHLGLRFEPTDALIIGDSLLDVDCGRSAGIPVAAVSTGFTPAEALRAAGADGVYEDLPSLAGDWDLH